MNEIEDHHIEKINEFFNKNLTLKKSIKIIITDVQMTVLFLWVLALFELNMMYIYANKNAMIRSQNIINNLFNFKILM